MTNNRSVQYQDKKKSEFLKADVKKLKAHMQKDGYVSMMPFIGNISLVKTKDAIKIATIFGVDFFMTKSGYDLGSDVICPAWACSSVSRADQSFFQHKKDKLIAWLFVPKKQAVEDEKVAGDKQEKNMTNMVNLSTTEPPNESHISVEVQIESLLN